jgi:hypothetical protein
VFSRHITPVDSRIVLAASLPCQQSVYRLAGFHQSICDIRGVSPVTVAGHEHCDVQIQIGERLVVVQFASISLCVRPLVCLAGCALLLRSSCDQSLRGRCAR